MTAAVLRPTRMESPRVFTARGDGTCSSRHGTPGLGSLVWPWGPLLLGVRGAPQATRPPVVGLLFSKAPGECRVRVRAGSGQGPG